jgi:cytochrome P450
MTDTPTIPAQATASDAPDYPMPRAAGCPLDPAPGLRELQVEAPITKVRWWDGSTPWLITGYADHRALLADPRISADSTHPSHPPRAAGMREGHQKHGRPFIRMDDPEHARLRRTVTAPFSIKRAEALRPAIQKMVDGLIDDLLAGPKPVDLVEAFALALPSLVICELLGVPYADRGLFHESSRLFVDRDADPQQAAEADQRLLGYLDRLIDEKLASPGDDLMSEVAARIEAGELSREEAGRVAQLLLLAGHDTTANMIALGTLALLQHPDQLAIVRETDNPAVIARAVEELLRYLSIVHVGHPRAALEDIEISGHVIRAGDGLLLPAETANRDPAVFAEPDRLDITRDARGHVAFAFGPHQCLGQNLARVELQVVYSTLYRRIPTLRLATSLDQIPFKHDGLVYGVHKLPVTW